MGGRAQIENDNRPFHPQYPQWVGKSFGRSGDRSAQARIPPTVPREQIIARAILSKPRPSDSRRLISSHPIVMLHALMPSFSRLFAIDSIPLAYCTIDSTDRLSEVLTAQIRSRARTGCCRKRFAAGPHVTDSL